MVRPLDWPQHGSRKCVCVCVCTWRGRVVHVCGVKGNFSLGVGWRRGVEEGVEERKGRGRG